MKLSKNKFLKGFVAATLLLALVRLVFPSVAQPLTHKSVAQADTAVVDSIDTTAVEKMKPSVFFDSKGQVVKHRIFSVPHFGNTFPDQNDVQLLAANKFGVSPVQNRDEAEHSKGKLVYVGSNPYFYVDKLNNSIPYLVPRASVLLQDIGKAYFDSLQIRAFHSIRLSSPVSCVPRTMWRNCVHATVMPPRTRVISMVLPLMCVTTGIRPCRRQASLVVRCATTL